MTRAGENPGPSRPLARPVRAAALGPVAELTPTQWAIRLAPPAILTGLLISLAIHVVGLVIAALVAIGGAQAGGAGEAPGAPVEFAVVTEAELADLPRGGLVVEAPTVPDIPMPGAPQIDLTEHGLGDGTVGFLEGPGDTGTVAGGGDIGGGSELGLGGTGGGAASFFGVEARGNRFGYVVDISGSMGIAGKLDALKKELTLSIDALMESAFFQIVAFNSGAAPLGGKQEWTQSSDSGKAWARRTIAKLEAGGGTVPMPAFRAIFAMKPKPDAIYFMTDGEFDDEVADELRFLNADFHIPIHCITFVSRDAEELMRRIAKESGGTYTHVEGPRQ